VVYGIKDDQKHDFPTEQQSYGITFQPKFYINLQKVHLNNALSKVLQEVNFDVK